MRLYIVFLFLRLFYLEQPAPLQFLELYSGGGFGPCWVRNRRRDFMCVRYYFLGPYVFQHSRGTCNGSTKRCADGKTYSEHSRSTRYSRIEIGLRTKDCAFWTGA